MQDKEGCRVKTKKKSIDDLNVQRGRITRGLIVNRDKGIINDGTANRRIFKVDQIVDRYTRNIMNSKNVVKFDKPQGYGTGWTYYDPIVKYERRTYMGLNEG